MNRSEIGVGPIASALWVKDAQPRCGAAGGASAARVGSPCPCPGEGMGRLLVVLLVLALTTGVHADQTGPVTLDSLLAEMVDLSSMARWPEPIYRQGQASSYDRASTDSRQSGEGDWFANRDRGFYQRVEQRPDRREHVMLDIDGPGVITRIWSANPAGTLRVYLDGASEPVIVEPMAEWMAGRRWLRPPWAGVRAMGHNVYLPIPFARGCKITSDAGDFYYIVNYRQYGGDVEVDSFDADDIAAIREGAMPGLEGPMHPVPKMGTAPNLEQTADLERRFVGPGVIRQLHVGVGPHEDPEAIKANLRRVLLELSFDGKRTARVPVGDFFGSGIGLNEYWDRYRSAGMRGWLYSRFVMPFAQAASVRLVTADGRPAPMFLMVRADTGPDAWPLSAGEPMLYFHADWRQRRGVPTRPRRDVTFLEARGRGLLVGDQLTIVNPVREWWGEGDEKIYIRDGFADDFAAGPDGTPFPSHFGTGTEDYYGYAWCSPEPFQHPLHSQVQSQGFASGTNYGTATVARLRGLDGIPFDGRLRFDMELWHWRDTEVDWATTAFFYATRETRTDGDLRAVVREANDPIPQVPPLPEPFAVPGAVELEAMDHVADTSPGLHLGPQGGFGPGIWSNEQQLWVQARHDGEWVELSFGPDDPGLGGDPAAGITERTPRRITARLTRSWDYGVVRVSVNGRVVAASVDAFNERAREVDAFDLDLGRHRPDEAGRFRLRFEAVGKHERSEGTSRFFGLDYVKFDPAE